MNAKLFRLCLVAAALCTSPATSNAQQPCWRATRACKAFIISEPSIARSVLLFGGPRDSAAYTQVEGELGYMKQRGEGRALGLSVFTGYDFGPAAVHYGVRVRGRWWRGPTAALDLSVGPMLSAAAPGKPGISSRIAYTHSEWFGVHAGLQLAPFSRVDNTPVIVGPPLGVRSDYMASVNAGVHMSGRAGGLTSVIGTAVLFGLGAIAFGFE